VTNNKRISDVVNVAEVLGTKDFLFFRCVRGSLQEVWLTAVVCTMHASRWGESKEKIQENFSRNI
jgi:hypothetical protein